MGIAFKKLLSHSTVTFRVEEVKDCDAVLAVTREGNDGDDLPISSLLFDFASSRSG